MRNRVLLHAAFCAAVAVALPKTASAQQPNYQRAEQMLTWNATRFVYGDEVAPNFYRDSTC